jgi:hypothetical protein
MEKRDKKDKKKDKILTGKEKRELNLKPAQNGEIRNPNGYPVGKKHFKTLYYEALEKIALKKGTTVEDEDLAIVNTGVRLAQKGNFNFYKDLLDRVHGTAVQNNANIDIKPEDVSPDTKKKIDDLLRKIL